MVTNNDEVDRDRPQAAQPRLGQALRATAIGFNSRLDDLHAGILSAKLKHIDEWNDLRRKWAARYTAGLDGRQDDFTLPYELPGYRHVFHLYVVETKRPAHRDPLLEFLNDNGIDAKCHYPIAIHQQEGYPWGKQAVHRRRQSRIPSATPPAASRCRCSPS